MLLWVFKLSFISVPCFSEKDSKSLNTSIFPFTNIAFIIWSFPHPASILFAFFPFSIIYLSIRPLKDSFTIFKSIQKHSLIGWSISKIFESFSIFYILIEVSLIEAPIEIKYCSFTFFISFFRQLSKINSIFILFYLECLNINIVNELTSRFIVLSYHIRVLKVRTGGMNAFFISMIWNFKFTDFRELNTSIFLLLFTFQLVINMIFYGIICDLCFYFLVFVFGNEWSIWKFPNRFLFTTFSNWVEGQMFPFLFIRLYHFLFSPKMSLAFNTNRLYTGIKLTDFCFRSVKHQFLHCFLWLIKFVTCFVFSSSILNCIGIRIDFHLFFSL